MSKEQALLDLAKEFMDILAAANCAIYEGSYGDMMQLGTLLAIFIDNRIQEGKSN